MGGGAHLHMIPPHRQRRRDGCCSSALPGATLPKIDDRLVGSVVAWHRQSGRHRKPHRYPGRAHSATSTGCIAIAVPKVLVRCSITNRSDGSTTMQGPEVQRSRRAIRHPHADLLGQLVRLMVAEWAGPARRRTRRPGMPTRGTFVTVRPSRQHRRPGGKAGRAGL